MPLLHLGGGISRRLVTEIKLASDNLAGGRCGEENGGTGSGATQCWLTVPPIIGSSCLWCQAVCRRPVVRQKSVERHQLYPALVALTTSRYRPCHIAAGASTDKGRVNLSDMAKAI